MMALELLLAVRPWVTIVMNSSGRELAYLLVHLENCSRPVRTVASLNVLRCTTLCSLS